MRSHTGSTLAYLVGSVCLNFEPFAKQGSFLFVESLVCVQAAGYGHKNNAIFPENPALPNRPATGSVRKMFFGFFCQTTVQLQVKSKSKETQTALFETKLS